jgi:hypothetical protein
MRTWIALALIVSLEGQDIVLVKRRQAAAGGGGIAILAGANGRGVCHGVNGCTTPAIDTTGGNFAICAVAAWISGPSDSFADSESNDWTPLTAREYVNGAVRLTPYYAYNLTTSSNHTFSNSGSGNYTAVACQVFSGVKSASDPFLDQNGTNMASSPINPMQAGSISVSAGNLVVAMEATAFGVGTTTYTIDLSFSITDQYHSAGVTEGVGIAWRLGDGTSLNPGWTPNVASGGAAAIASFSKP